MLTVVVSFRLPRPWFREMLADQDDDCLVSALRAVAAHYRRAAQQQALGRKCPELMGKWWNNGGTMVENGDF